MAASIAVAILRSLSSVGNPSVFTLSLSVKRLRFFFLGRVRYHPRSILHEAEDANKKPERELLAASTKVRVLLLIRAYAG